MIILSTQPTKDNWRTFYTFMLDINAFALLGVAVNKNYYN